MSADHHRPPPYTHSPARWAWDHAASAPNAYSLNSSKPTHCCSCFCPATPPQSQPCVQLRGLLGYARDRGLMTPADAAPLTAALGWLLAAEGFPGEAARLAGEAGGVYAGREEAGRSGGGPHLTPSERRTQVRVVGCWLVGGWLVG